VDQVPVGPDYVIGPDDEIRIAVWGKVEGRWACSVDRDGNINVPKIGILGVTGLTFRELKELLDREFSKYFTGYDMSVSMGSLRTMKVYIVGNASRPGAYTVSSLATLVNALIGAGGPSKTGTMRDIQVKRNGMTAVHFDMYDLLLSGDKSGDIRLMPEDVIFIPPVGPLAAIIGNVRTPAIYELKNEAKLSDLIRMAGGRTGFAFKGRIQLQRTEHQEARTIFEGDLVSIEKTPGKNIVLRDWDIARVFDVAERNNVVRITGAVANGGEFGIVPNVTTIKELIARTGGLLYYASTSAEVTRVKVTQEGPVTERFTVDLAKALAGDPQNNVALEMNDYIFVRSVPEWQLYRTVTVSGQVRYPGTYTIKKGERLSSLLERAGGYTDRAYLRGAVFTRERVRELQQRNLETMIIRLERELLAEGASVRSASAEGVEARKIELQQKQAFIESLKRTRATGRLTIRLANLRLLKGSEFDVELEDKDSLTIPMNNRVVSVVGAVMSNTTMVHLEKVSAKEYIRMAGGYSRYADAKNSYILSVDGSARKLAGGLITWSDPKERWEMAGFGSDRKDIEAGDTIVVPEKLDRVAWLREIKDITQILANVAVAAGAVYLFSK
jgi:protein involved in polysaccharide export with SLBB domain